MNTQERGEPPLTSPNRIGLQGRVSLEYTEGMISALQIYAKIGGTPWTVKSSAQQGELVLGVSRALDPQQKMVVGFVSLFTYDGDYQFLYSLAPKPADFSRLDEYREAFAQLIVEAYTEYQHYQGTPTSLVIHLCKRPGKYREIAAVEKALRQIGNTIPYALLHLNGPLAFRCWLQEQMGNLPDARISGRLSETIQGMTTDRKESLLRDPEQVFLFTLGLRNYEKAKEKLIVVAREQMDKGPLKRRVLYTAALREMDEQTTVPKMDPQDPGDVIALVWWAERYPSELRKDEQWQRFGSLREIAHDHFCNGKYVVAVEQACKALNEFIKHKSGAYNQSEAELVQATMNPKNPKIKFNEFLNEKSGRNEQAGLALICEGVFKAFRNPKAHKPESDPLVQLDPYEALAQLVTISYLMVRIEDSKG